MNKLKSNKGASLTIALVVFISISLIAISLVFAAGLNARTRLNKVNKEANKLIIENTMYSFLNSCALGDTVLNTDSNQTVTYQTYEVIITYDSETTYYLASITYNKDTLDAEVSFTTNSYDIIKWGFR